MTVTGKGWLLRENLLCNALTYRARQNNFFKLISEFGYLVFKLSSETGGATVWWTRMQSCRNRVVSPVSSDTVIYIVCICCWPLTHVALNER